jgi:hypothetical protein
MSRDYRSFAQIQVNALNWIFFINAVHQASLSVVHGNTAKRGELCVTVKIYQIIEPRAPDLLFNSLGEI